MWLFPHRGQKTLGGFRTIHKPGCHVLPPLTAWPKKLDQKTSPTLYPWTRQYSSRRLLVAIYKYKCWKRARDLKPELPGLDTGLVLQMAKRKVSEIGTSIRASVRPALSPQIREVTSVVGPTLLDFYTVSNHYKMMHRVRSYFTAGARNGLWRLLHVRPNSLLAQVNLLSSCQKCLGLWTIAYVKPRDWYAGISTIWVLNDVVYQDLPSRFLKCSSSPYNRSLHFCYFPKTILCFAWGLVKFHWFGGVFKCLF